MLSGSTMSSSDLSVLASIASIAANPEASIARIKELQDQTTALQQATEESRALGVQLQNQRAELATVQAQIASEQENLDAAIEAFQIKAAADRRDILSQQQDTSNAFNQAQASLQKATSREAAASVLQTQLDQLKQVLDAREQDLNQRDVALSAAEAALQDRINQLKSIVN